MRKLNITLIIIALLLNGMVHAEYDNNGGGISDAPSDGTQYARKDAGWEAVTATASGGSSARVVPVDDYYLNQSPRPDRVALQDGSGDVHDYYRWEGDATVIDRLDPIRVYADAGTFSPVFSSSGFITNALSQTNAVLIGYVDNVGICTSAVVNLSAVTIDTFWTNGLFAVTGSVTLATGWHKFDARLTSVGGTNEYIYSSDINIDLGSAE